MKLKIKAFQNNTMDTQECPITGQEFCMGEFGYLVNLDGKPLGFLGYPSYFDYGFTEDDIRKAINANPEANDLTGAEIIIDHTLEDISISSETASEFAPF